MVTYFVEYQCTKAQQRYNGILEFDSKRFPNERKIRTLINRDTDLTRVQNLSWMVVGKWENANV